MHKSRIRHTRCTHLCPLLRAFMDLIYILCNHRRDTDKVCIIHQSISKRISSSFHWKLTCSRQDIAEELLSWRYKTITWLGHLIGDRYNSYWYLLINDIITTTITYNVRWIALGLICIWLGMYFKINLFCVNILITNMYKY